MFGQHLLVDLPKDLIPLLVFDLLECSLKLVSVLMELIAQVLVLLGAATNQGQVF